MDSRLAADPIVRFILDVLSMLENAAGVRAHYRVLESPPLASVELSSITTVARVLSDWVGLRNAVFNISVIEIDQPPRIIRLDPDQEEFALELPASQLQTPASALATIARQVARAYLITSNIGGSSIDPERTAGSRADVTAIFLGMGKILLNSPTAGTTPASSLPANQPQELASLSPDYLAFTHRLVCAMRGLDWSQHIAGLSTEAVKLLRQWDPYRDTVFSQALRNVLTASASHRPLMDAIEDNHLALARFDQLRRVFSATVLRPLDSHIEAYHATCREGFEHLGTREQDTYDPCMLYLNQLRRRMDLQRYADMLLAQQDQVLRDLRVLTAALADLNGHGLVETAGAEPLMHTTHCPFDGTPISIHDANQDSRVRCPQCGYAFLATSGIPQIAALERSSPPLLHDPAQEVKQPAPEKARAAKKPKPAPSPAAKAPAPAPKREKNRGATIFTWGIGLMPLAWAPMLGYVLVQILKGKDAPLVEILGRIGIGGSIIAAALIIIGLFMMLSRYLGRRKTPPPSAPAQAPASAVGRGGESAESQNPATGTPVASAEAPEPAPETQEAVLSGAVPPK